MRRGGNGWRHDAELDAELAARIRTRRQDRGLTQEQLAQRVGVGVRSISNYERGEGAMRMSVGTALRMASVLQMPIGRLLPRLK